MAEQYPNDPKNVATPGAVREETRTTTVVQEGAKGHGAREYAAPERKGFPWWVLLLGLIPLLFFLFRGRNNEERQPAPVVAAASPSPAVAADTSTAESAAQPPAPAADREVFEGKDVAVSSQGAASAQGEPLSDVASFAQAADPAALIGRRAKLTDASVGRVLNDRAFYVTSGEGQQMLVLLDEGMNAAAGASGAARKVTLKEGGQVSLTGVVKALPDQTALQQYGLSGEDVAGLGQQAAYLHATVAQRK